MDMTNATPAHLPLSYEACRKLRDAGFPQDERYGAYWLDGELARWDNIPEHGKYEWCACPNSDELLAALQAEWPDASICLSITTNRCEAFIARHASSHKWDEELARDTPAAALAELWCALKEAK